MKARPILFSGAMVRALLAGTKTQTRRIVKDIALELIEPDMFTPEFVADPGNHLCPYGYPGDLLWVKERLARSPDVWTYFADGAEVEWPARAALASKRLDYAPSIHMPKIANRLTGEITEVRVERLQDISEADAMAEGTPPELVPPDGGSAPHVEGYRTLWDQINGATCPWSSNPWVWVVSFKVHHQNVDALMASRAAA